MSKTFPSIQSFAISLALAIVAVMTSCKSGFERIDERVEALIAEGQTNLGPDAHPPANTKPWAADARVTRPSSSTDERPPTINPAADDLQFTAAHDAEHVLERLQQYGEPVPDALKMDLNFALSYATRSSREYKFAEEDYVLSALRLLIERHLWGPRFFDEVSALVVAEGDDGFYETSLALVNELKVTQRLPYGGEISARALATATEDLHSRVSDGNAQDATLILAANVPLLRGAGLVAREDLIQAQRDLIYAARDFESFRRDFLFDVAQDFLNLVVQQKQVTNAQRQVERLKQLENRQQGLYEAGRTPRFEAALAEQDTVAALDTLNVRQEIYRLAVDQFKVRLGIPYEQPVTIVESSLDLPIPRSDLEEAVRMAMAYRLDLQTRRDVVDDATRQLANANNDLLPDLNLTGSASLPTDRTKTRGGVDFQPNDSTFTAGATLSVPLDRNNERISVRQAQIRLARAQRETDLLRDNIALRVRAAVRDIDRARYTLHIQEQSIEIGKERQASIEAAPDRATARDASDAANQLLRAVDRRDTAARDLQVAILRYLVESGQLRVDADGFIRPLRGMEIPVRNAADIPNAQPAPIADPND